MGKWIDVPAPHYLVSGRPDLSATTNNRAKGLPSFTERLPNFHASRPPPGYWLSPLSPATFLRRRLRMSHGFYDAPLFREGGIESLPGGKSVPLVVTVRLSLSVKTRITRVVFARHMLYLCLCVLRMRLCVCWCISVASGEFFLLRVCVVSALLRVACVFLFRPLLQ